MTTIRESGFVLKIATGSAIGITDQSQLDPENMSSGSATLGQVPSADGAGGITWSDEIGPVPSGRQILNGTGITGGGDLSADRTLSVVQSALDPANMSSGSATSGQLPTASGGGAISWQDLPASINLPGSSTDHALVRWDGTGGDTVLDSGVTLSDAGAMVFPAAGSISKPGAGAGSEVFGAGSTADAASTGGTVVGPSSSLTNSIGGTVVGGAASAASNEAIALGFNALVGTSSAQAMALGYNSNVYAPSAANNNGALAIGSGAVVGNSTPGAGCGGALAIGLNSLADAGADSATALGENAWANQQNSVAIGFQARVHIPTSGDNANAVAIGAAAAIGSTSGAGCDAAVAVGRLAEVGPGNLNATAIGDFAKVYPVASGDSAGAIALGSGATIGNATPGAGCDAAIALGSGATVGVGHQNAVAIGVSAASTASNRVTFASTLEVEIGQGLGVWGVTPPGSQPAKINDVTATAGASYTATEQGMLNDLKARVNSIIDVLEGAGFSSAT